MWTTAGPRGSSDQQGRECRCTLQGAAEPPGGPSLGGTPVGRWMGAELVRASLPPAPCVAELGQGRGGGSHVLRLTAEAGA